MPHPFQRIGIVGLGYVGLPLAVAFARRFPVVGFDINRDRIRRLGRGDDETGETSADDLLNPNIELTSDPARLRECDVVIIAVPTPVNRAREPDLTALRSATEIVGDNLREGAVVVYESTVYPGVTEQVCVPILEARSGLEPGRFKVGYSPERINPGDREHTVDQVIKVVAASDPETLDRLADLYGTVAKAGVHRAPNIMTAEAAKVIENIQRDLNIALMNELSIIFRLLGIRTRDVLEAAGTKWNFHPYTPGLVGGHCIGVDPYYLTYRSLELGYHPGVILAGRGVNDGMGRYVADLTLKRLSEAGKVLSRARVLILGLTFKENVPDIRNSKVIDVIHRLQEFGVAVVGWDPLLSEEVVRDEFGIDNRELDDAGRIDGVIVCSPHRQFASIGIDALARRMDPPVVVDVKGMYDPGAAAAAGVLYECL